MEKPKGCGQETPAFRESYLLNFEALDVVKALLEVGLDGLRVTGLAQDLQEVIVGEEVETGKDMTLGLQVHVKGLLDVF